MSTPNEDLHRLADELPPDLAGEIVDIANVLRARRLARSKDLDAGVTEEDRAWMDADLSRMSEEEPYDWAGTDPLEGQPVYWDAQRGAFMAGEPA